MSKAKKQKIYVVIRGRRCGFFGTWEQCRKLVEYQSGSIYKSFTNYEAALQYWIVNQFMINQHELIFNIEDSYFATKSKEEFLEYLEEYL